MTRGEYLYRIGGFQLPPEVKRAVFTPMFLPRLSLEELSDDELALLLRALNRVQDAAAHLNCPPEDLDIVAILHPYRLSAHKLKQK